MFQEKIEVKNMRGGVGSVLIEKASSNMMNCKMYARITILPSSSIGMHVHENDEEMVYVLSGKGQAYVNGELFDIFTGTYHHARQGNQHSIINNTNENLVILAVINE